MAKTNSNSDATKAAEQLAKQRQEAQDHLKALATPGAGKTLDEMFQYAANTVLVNVGTWVVPKVIPTAADFSARVELAFQDTPVLKSDEDYSSLVDAVVAVHSPVSHDRRKFAYTEALRIAAERYCEEQNAPITAANTEAVIKQFRGVTGDNLPKAAKRISDAMNNGVLKLRRDRRQTAGGDKPSSVAFDVSKL
jgi:hypothetical protein